MDLAIKDGRIYTSQGFIEGSIYINEGKIAAIAKSDLIRSDNTIDACGGFILPGMIDMHVHLRDPGSPEREDFESGTRAAACGGVTTVADMPNTSPSVTTLEAFKEKRRRIRNKAVVDYALIAGAGEVAGEALRSMAEAGAAAFKSFMIARFKELAASDGQMLDNFRVISQTGRPCLMHAENESIVAHGIEVAKKLNRKDPITHVEFRPAIAEVEATARTILLARETRVKLHICHMTCKGGVEVLRHAKKEGLKVTGETSPNYLLLTSDAMLKLGPYAKIDPPLRSVDDQLSLWEALRSGGIDVLASDHAPYTREEKDLGWKDIFEAPSGSVAIETSLPLMLDSVNRGLITLDRVVEVFSVNPAKILGLYPKKGALAVGSDADFVIVDMKRPFTILGERLHSKQKHTPFEGWRGEGAPLYTILRGCIVMEAGEAVGKPGYGEFQKPVS
ncbi:dihydroorotase family protein [Candidatus Bathyarchaeota archaeon]|nr:dihydroorotase family protein [Candidatus Bathyarchaeota archaeon]